LQFPRWVPGECSCSLTSGPSSADVTGNPGLAASGGRAALACGIAAEPTSGLGKSGGRVRIEGRMRLGRPRPLFDPGVDWAYGRYTKAMTLEEVRSTLTGESADLVRRRRLFRRIPSPPRCKLGRSGGNRPPHGRGIRRSDWTGRDGRRLHRARGCGQHDRATRIGSACGRGDRQRGSGRGGGRRRPRATQGGDPWPDRANRRDRASLD
jgi:hypothetical protein